MEGRVCFLLLLFSFYNADEKSFFFFHDSEFETNVHILGFQSGKWELPEPNSRSPDEPVIDRECFWTGNDDDDKGLILSSTKIRK